MLNTAIEKRIDYVNAIINNKFSDHNKFIISDNLIEKYIAAVIDYGIKCNIYELIKNPLKDSNRNDFEVLLKYLLS